jgi:hypothetical protein
LSDGEAALLIVAMRDWEVRDKLLGWATTGSEAMRALLHDLAVRAVPPYDAPACTAYAWVSYVHGRGVVATAALERALKTDPDYSLALLLDEALARQVPPSLLREASIFC